MTQEEFDNRISVFVNKHLCRTNIISSYERSKDPYVIELKRRERLLENVISSLSGYDLSSDILTDSQLRYLFELGICSGRSCGRCTEWKPRTRYINPISPIFYPKYGLLYNWYAATDVRNITAEGWHVPTKAEYVTLYKYLGGYLVAGGKLKEIGFTYWNNPNVGATNEAWFNARGAGQRSWLNGSFATIKAVWVTHTTDSYITGYGGASMQYDYAHFNISVFTGAAFEKEGTSLRLLKDTTTLTHGQTGYYMGNDGHRYDTICIGGQEWLSSNLIETLYRNGDPIPEVTDNAAWAALDTGALCAYNNDWSNV